MSVYNDPIIGKRRKGTPNDPYLNITETLQIINGRAVLTEIPNRFQKVKVSDGSKVYWFESEGELKGNSFKVDYSKGVVFFDSIHNGTSLTFTYLGEGVHYFPSDRVYFDDSDDSVVTVKDKINEIDVNLLEQKNRVDEQIRSVPQPSEVVDTRIDSNGKIYPVAKDRVDAEQKKIEDTYNASNGKKYDSMADRFDSIDDKFLETIFHHEVHTEKHRAHSTDYYLTYIPHEDEEGNAIKIKRGFANDIPNGGAGETARSFSHRHNATVTVNASIFDVSTLHLQGTDIYEGTVLSEGVISARHIIGIKTDNTLVTYPPNTSPQTIKNDGCYNALTAFIPLILNGKRVDSNIIDSYTAAHQKHPRQVICQLPNKDIMIFTCDGRTRLDLGMTCDEVINILLAKGVRFAQMLDGGGSSQTIVKGVMVNKPIDNNGQSEREVPDFLYFTKENLDEVNKDKKYNYFELGELGKKISEVRAKVDNKYEFLDGFIRLRGAEGYDTQGIESWEGNSKNTKLLITKNALSFYEYATNMNIFTVLADGTLSTKKGTLGNFLNRSSHVSDLNEITENGMYWTVPNSKNSPDDDLSWAIIHFEYGIENRAAYQLAIPYTREAGMKCRRLPSGSSNWENWGTLSSTNWVNIALLNGATVSLSRTPKFRILNDMVQLEGEINGVESGTIIATLPSGYRPPHPRLFICALNTSINAQLATMMVEPNGNITVYATSDATKAISLNGIQFSIN